MEFKKTIDILDKVVNKIINNIDNENKERKTLLPTIVHTDTIKCKDCDLDSYVIKVKSIYRKPQLIYPAKPNIYNTVTPIYNTYDQVCDMV
jgi:hypothetical protein